MTKTTIAATAAPTIDNNVTFKSVTSHKIGKITYQVMSTHSVTATETAKQKVEKMILRECDRMMK